MYLRVGITFLLFITSVVLVPGKTSFSTDSIPSYFVSVLSEKESAINSAKNKVASFVFITDTHVQTNQMQAPQLIQHLLEHTRIKNVIWGGDAIGAYGTATDIEMQWEKQALFDSLINQSGNLYKIRGNHDFTIKESSSSNKGFTYSQRKTAQMLLEGHPSNIVLNSSDPEACYYYFDAPDDHLRYIVFDTTDSVREENVAWGTIYGVHDKQLQWIADSAIASTPKGYDIVFFSHVPFTDTTGSRHAVLSNVREVVDAASKKTAGRIGDVNYNFTQLKRTSVLMCLSGHNHSDMQTYRNGVVHMVTACDAAYNDYKDDPFVRNLSGMIKGTENEQCFDCISINRNKRLISVYRVGVGGDRFFHTKSLAGKVGKKKHLKTFLKNPVEWYSYNASGNIYNGKWTLSNDVVSVDGKGNVVCMKKGEAVVFAIDAEGKREFYNIEVK